MLDDVVVERENRLTLFAGWIRQGPQAPLASIQPFQHISSALRTIPPPRALGEPAEHLAERTRNPDDMSAMKLHDRLVAALVCIVDDPDALRPYRIPDAIELVVTLSSASG